MDSDGDGVTDDKDQCPNTPKGEYVDKDGCTLKLTLHINFAFDKADIKPEFKPDLDQAAAFIKRNTEVPYILIAGHTDHTGTVEYNQELSEKRAQNVRQYLIDNYGIDPDRLGARGYGKSQPIASNQTEEGRYENRRVEIICCVVKPQ
jgi:OOP family OmpA-OmpF porin